MVTIEEIKSVAKDISDSLEQINETLKEINENTKIADTQCTDQPK